MRFYTSQSIGISTNALREKNYIGLRVYGILRGSNNFTALFYMLWINYDTVDVLKRAEKRHLNFFQIWEKANVLCTESYKLLVLDYTSLFAFVVTECTTAKLLQ